MKIQRTYKEVSLKRGLTEVVDESKAREVFGQTRIAHHAENECKPKEYFGSHASIVVNPPCDDCWRERLLKPISAHGS